MEILKKLDRMLEMFPLSHKGMLNKAGTKRKEGTTTKRHCSNDPCNKVTVHTEDQFGHTCTKCGQKTMKKLTGAND